MKRILVFSLVLSFAILFNNTITQYIKGKVMKYSIFAGTLRIITPYIGGLIVAADSKGSPYQMAKEEFNKIIKSDEIKRKLIYHQKIFRVGKNLVAAYGGQLIRDSYKSIRLPGHLNESFLRTHSIEVNQNFQIDDIANKLLNFLKDQYYSQPSEFL